MAPIRSGFLLLTCGWLFAENRVLNPPVTVAPSVELVSQEAPARSQIEPDRLASLPRLFWADAGQVVCAPGRWDRSDWVTAGTGAAAVLGTALLLDHSAEHFLANHANSSWDRKARAVQNLGSTPSVLFAGGTYLTGIAFKNPEVRGTGIDLMVTMALSQVLFTLPIKYLAGRSRPSATQGTHDFNPLSGAQSFPSGHTTQAFALASVIAEHADRPWVSCLSYGLAGLVGVARMEQHQHFMSDVLAGGLIGTFVGKTVVSYNQGLRATAGWRLTVSLAPILQPGGCGLSLVMTY